MAAGIVALIHPVATFAGLADIRGAVFLLVAVLWMVPAFTQRASKRVLVDGPHQRHLDGRTASWVGGQYFLTRGAMLLVFADKSQRQLAAELGWSRKTVRLTQRSAPARGSPPTKPSPPEPPLAPRRPPSGVGTVVLREIRALPAARLGRVRPFADGPPI